MAWPKIQKAPAGLEPTQSYLLGSAVKAAEA